MFFKSKINKGLSENKETDNSVLVDVRDADEYKSGYILEAINIPLSRLQIMSEDMLPDKKAAVFVYCLSGMRSKKAVKILQSLGYKDARNIGGINDYKSALEYKTAMGNIVLSRD